jgi:hypothetical protein
VSWHSPQSFFRRFHHCVPWGIDGLPAVAYPPIILQEIPLLFL